MDSKKNAKLFRPGWAEHAPEGNGPVRQLGEQPPELLVSIVESQEYPIDYRLAAGEALARRGDPRISLTNPSMIDIPAGRVRVGLAESEMDSVFEQSRSFGVMRDVLEFDGPEHLVELSPFRMAKYCVTNTEYYEFEKATGFQNTPTSWSGRHYDRIKSNHPVFSVSYAAALAYCEWLTDLTGRSFRLPTEAEWEFVSSGSDHLRFPWGNEFEPDRANTIETQMMSTTPVGMFANGCSPFGVSDMAGNVEEYTSSSFNDYLGRPIIGTNGARSLEGMRIARGGSFARFHDLTRTSCRHPVCQPDKVVIGFRLVEDLPLH
ncbi:formylglycine-generating enzyme family protein [Reinekea blandensis]|uniref:formylglycine-generating enzyme family protein n=1 Tax=Reinekea blandensis TaxID=374838 RepID=UPI0002EA2AA6|nr:SUMF1/EgtB/PvdO family nonheme iron enzyme [Reinekea blandensis]